ncbi:hypothetical protein O3P69_013900 [Scylla paramamosain]|uniref:Uncharacterized protein n=2 Tax=Scylla paramamosain TaxID=85552 RepID=A0AAW0SQX1_SCYPA
MSRGRNVCCSSPSEPRKVSSMGRGRTAVLTPQNLECMKRTMSPKGWCHSVLVVQAGAVFLVLGPVGELVQRAEAVVAYSTQNQPSVYSEELTNQKLESFSQLWQGIFLWGFFSILFIHIVSAIIAFLMLRRHKYGRYSAACVLLFGMCTTFVMCVATSVAVGFVLYQAKITLQPIEAMTQEYEPMRTNVFGASKKRGRDRVGLPRIGQCGVSRSPSLPCLGDAVNFVSAALLSGRGGAVSQELSLTGQLMPLDVYRAVVRQVRTQVPRGKRRGGSGEADRNALPQ